MSLDVASTFRTQELHRRVARRERLFQELESLRKRYQNEGMLLHEVLSEEDKKAHIEATIRIKAQQIQFEKETRPGYWQRLWYAILGR